MDKEKNSNEEIKVEPEELINRTNIEDLKEVMTNPSEISEVDDDYSDLHIAKSFKVGKIYWRDGNSPYEKKAISFAFTPTKDETELWASSGIPKLSSLLTHLKNKYGDFNSFNLIFLGLENQNHFILRTSLL